MKKIITLIAIACIVFCSCKKENEVAPDSIIGQWASLGSYPRNYVLEIKTIDGSGEFTLSADKSTLLWESEYHGVKSFTVISVRNDIMVLKEGEVTIIFKKGKTYPI